MGQGLELFRGGPGRVDELQRPICMNDLEGSGQKSEYMIDRKGRIGEFLEMFCRTVIDCRQCVHRVDRNRRRYDNHRSVDPEPRIIRSKGDNRLHVIVYLQSGNTGVVVHRFPVGEGFVGRSKTVDEELFPVKVEHRETICVSDQEIHRLWTDILNQ